VKANDSEKVLKEYEEGMQRDRAKAEEMQNELKEKHEEQIAKLKEEITVGESRMSAQR